MASHVRIADRPPTTSLIVGVPGSIDLLTPVVARISLISRCTRVHTPPSNQLKKLNSGSNPSWMRRKSDNLDISIAYITLSMG